MKLTKEQKIELVVVILIALFALLLNAIFHYDPNTPSSVTTPEAIEFKELIDGTKYYPIFKLTDDGTCSGFVVSEKHALTAAHCLSKRSKYNALKKRKTPIITIYPFDREDKPLKGYAIAYDDNRDIAVIEADFSQFQAYEVDLVGTYLPHDLNRANVTMCGYPYFGYLRCAKATFHQHEDFLIVVAGEPIFPGMSGGPVTIDIGYVGIYGWEVRKVVVGIISAASGNTTYISNVLGINYDLSFFKHTK